MVGSSDREELEVLLIKDKVGLSVGGGDRGGREGSWVGLVEGVTFLSSNEGYNERDGLDVLLIGKPFSAALSSPPPTPCSTNRVIMTAKEIARVEAMSTE